MNANQKLSINILFSERVFPKQMSLPPSSPLLPQQPPAMQVDQTPVLDTPVTLLSYPAEILIAICQAYATDTFVSIDQQWSSGASVAYEVRFTRRGGADGDFQPLGLLSSAGALRYEVIRQLAMSGTPIHIYTPVDTFIDHPPLGLGRSIAEVLRIKARKIIFSAQPTGGQSLATRPLSELRHIFPALQHVTLHEAAQREHTCDMVCDYMQLRKDSVRGWALEAIPSFQTLFDQAAGAGFGLTIVMHRHITHDAGIVDWPQAGESWVRFSIQMLAPGADANARRKPD